MTKKIYCGIGWKYDIPMHLEYYEEIAYSLASKGYILRTNTNKVGSQAFVNGVERYSKNKKRAKREATGFTSNFFKRFNKRVAPIPKRIARERK